MRFGSPGKTIPSGQPLGTTTEAPGAAPGGGGTSAPTGLVPESSVVFDPNTGHAHDGSDSHTVDHANLANVTANQHHNQAHAISGADHTGTLNVSQLPYGALHVYPETTPAQLTADQNDYALHASAYYHRMSTDASRTVTGFVAPAVNRQVAIINVGTQNLVLANENAGSSAANRIITGTGADVTLAALARAVLFYDLTSTRWRIL